MRYTRPLLTAIAVGCLALSQLGLANGRRESRIVDALTSTAGTGPSEQSESIEQIGQPPGPISGTTTNTTTVIDTTCLELVDVELGQTAKVLRADGQSFAGVWSADFGQVTSDGTYIAPRNISAPGVDRIVFRVDPGGPDEGELTVWVRLVPSTRPPVPESQEIVIGSTEPGSPENPQPPGSGSPFGSSQSTFTPAPDLMLDPGPALNLASIEIAGDTGYVVPAYFRGTLAPATIAVVLGYPEQGVKRSKCGLFPPPTGTCSPAAENGQFGPEKEIVTSTWQRQKQWITIDETLSVATGLPVGQHEVSFDIRRLVKYQYMDHYICQYWAWVYHCTRICHTPGTEYRAFSPAGAARYFFPFGARTVEWGVFECKTYSRP